jgi:thioredoxin reductase
MDAYDGVIIGGGAAGLSAALVLARARRQVLVVDSGTPRNAPAAQMHGFLSRDGMPPADLVAAGREEVRGYGATITTGAAKDLVRCGQAGFQVIDPPDRRDRLTDCRLSRAQVQSATSIAAVSPSGRPV